MHRSEPRYQFPVEQIQKHVADHFGQTVFDIKGYGRAREFARARWVAMYLAHELTRLSSTHLARWFGNRDHTSVLSAMKIIRKMMAEDRDFRSLIHSLLMELANIKDVKAGRFREKCDMAQAIGRFARELQPQPRESKAWHGLDAGMKTKKFHGNGSTKPDDSVPDLPSGTLILNSKPYASVTIGPLRLGRWGLNSTGDAPG